MLREALDVIEAWGFSYKTVAFNWVKQNRNGTGIFMGLGIASKWTVAYGAVGLAVLFFGKLIVSYREEKGHAAVQKAPLNKSIKLCLWCCLLFIAIPFLSLIHISEPTRH